MKTYTFEKKERIECSMTTCFEVEAMSLKEAKSLIVNGNGEQVGVMFTEADVLEEGEVTYVKNG